ncbi:hypothetical protein MAR_026789 [Mya arenaria]|uniref:Uncharacterized protein n=1 Tax=Mya arenaria TaxID=6604 RepID=A0ABY7EUI0_MYAAR|nr:hypothetical protein MAR_026789 [Mya arenaria]
MYFQSEIYSCDVVSEENVRKAVKLFCSVLSSTDIDETTKHSLLILQDYFIKCLPFEGSGVWKSAKVYFLKDNRFILQSGPGIHPMRVLFNIKGEASIEKMTHPGPTDSHRSTQAHPPVSRQRSKSARVVRPAAQSTSGDKQKHFEFPCEEINQRSVGKAILRFCGNEGTVDNSNKATLRRLLQALISYVPLEPQTRWKDAEVKIYDDDCDVYRIYSGNGQNRFVGTFDGMGNARIVRAKYDKSECCVM